MSKQAGKGGAAAGKPKKPAKPGADEKREDVLQAVILADSFQDRFKPFTLQTPRCLLPLVNVPVIEYTLEFLASNGVQDVFIYCGAHSEDVEHYIHESSRWNPNSAISPFSSLEFIRVSDANSIGDFLRDLDKRSIISGDFILVHGDVVSNIQLDAALAKHRARREANRDACMTVVLRSVGEQPHRAAKARGITPVFVVDPTTGRCLQYDETHPLQSEHYLNLDPAVFSHGEFEIRTDLVDCGIDICTPEVLALWSESFDYELPRKNFLHGVLKDWELNGKMLYAEILDDGYAARASNLQMYDCISQDVLERWTLPFVPDSNLIHGQTYRRAKGGNYFEDHVVTERGSKVTQSAIGRGTTIKSGSVISGSAVGRRCKIGKNVRIENSYIWDDTVIGDGVSVVHSILAGSVVVGADCHIPEGSLISYHVHIDSGIQMPLKPPARISVLTDDRKLADADVSLVGKGGKGALYEVVADEEESDDEEGASRDPAVLQSSLIYSLEGLNVSTSSISTLDSEDEYDSDDDISVAGSLQTGDFGSTRDRLSSFASDDAHKPDGFHNDAVHGLVDALRADDSDDFDSAKLEFMGLRLANNASDSAMRRAIAVAFVRRTAELLAPEHGGLEPTKAAGEALTSKNGAVKFVKEVGVGGEGVPQQAEFALAVQKALLGVRNLEAAKAGALLAAVLQQLYSLDVLEEEGILAWWADKRAGESEHMNALKEKCRVLVEWLENADEEESSDDEEDEEEDDDEDESD
ncbi:putative translation initiation factor eIF-2B subunit epsilon [Chaetomidium leptoderma]|uniref:Mannose-1-phosphate guanyltransferase n=1 Tax=Chaetomidium leptoderma TaxID=669021 RepID=A0AAN6VRH0_9PEZI|nr:putative translation initiation factor eIF-2B subunit epsilon [Chaetomidium leptoderma]